MSNTITKIMSLPNYNSSNVKDELAFDDSFVIVDDLIDSMSIVTMQVTQNKYCFTLEKGQWSKVNKNTKLFMA